MVMDKPVDRALGKLLRTLIDDQGMSLARAAHMAGLSAAEARVVLGLPAHHNNKPGPLKKREPRVDPVQQAKKFAAYVSLRQLGMTLDEIGRYFGVSRERARQIIKKAKEHGMEVGEIPRRKMKRSAKSLALDEQIRELNAQGKNHREIADELGRPHSVVTHHASKMGLRSPWNQKPEWLDEAIRLAHEGHSRTEIADRLGKTLAKVSNRLVRHGVRKNRFRHRTTPEERAAMVRAYEAGATVAAICREFDIADPSVGNILRKAGVQMRTHPYGPRRSGQRSARAVEMYQLGHKPAEIARVLGYKSKSSVHSALERHRQRQQS